MDSYAVFMNESVYPVHVGPCVVLRCSDSGGLDLMNIPKLGFKKTGSPMSLSRACPRFCLLLALSLVFQNQSSAHFNKMNLCSTQLLSRRLPRNLAKRVHSTPRSISPLRRWESLLEHVGQAMGHAGTQVARIPKNLMLLKAD